MAHHKDAIKRIRTSQAARARNRADKSRMRTQLKALTALIESGDHAAAAAALPETVSILQKMARKGVIHRHNASRRVSGLTLKVNALKPRE